MSLLIIVYLAIVLILVLVTMLLLRWHKVLRTPLDVLSDSRVHQSPPMVMEDRELTATAVTTSNNTNNTPATVSIMVMYRPHKPRGFSQVLTSKKIRGKTLSDSYLTLANFSCLFT